MYIDNGIIIQNADTSFRVYLYRGKLKLKRNRLPCREMPFFSGGQNDGVLFAYDGHILYIICIKNCTKQAYKKDRIFVIIYNCILLPDAVLYNQTTANGTGAGPPEA